MYVAIRRMQTMIGHGKLQFFLRHLLRMRAVLGVLCVIYILAVGVEAEAASDLAKERWSSGDELKFYSGSQKSIEDICLGSLPPIAIGLRTIACGLPSYRLAISKVEKTIQQSDRWILLQEAGSYSSNFRVHLLYRIAETGEWGVQVVSNKAEEHKRLPESKIPVAINLLQQFDAPDMADASVRVPHDYAAYITAKSANRISRFAILNPTNDATESRAGTSENYSVVLAKYRALVELLK